MYKKYLKRIIDIIISAICLILFLPLYLLIGISIKIFDKGKIFYKQERTGIKGKNFKLYKFRSMKDGKVTKIGKLLRMTSLDELPQLYNILKGEMSLVGPRPWIPEYYERFNEKQKQRTKVRPGLVGLAQVNGRKDVYIFDKIKFDIEYIEKVSFWMDIKILIRSLKVIISKQDANLSDMYIKNELQKLENQKVSQ